MFRTLFCSSLLVLAAACGTGNDGLGGVQTAEVSVVLTDGASDQLAAFEVDVNNIVFTKTNGDTVDVLSRAVRVDFLQLDSLAELVAARSLDAGSYRRVTMDLDFANARVVIVDRTTPALVKDRSGAVITGVVPVVIDFPTGSRPVMRGNRNNLWAFDLNLDQSVAVDVPGNVVTFTPVITSEVDAANPKPLAANGTLKSVDPTQRTFVVERRAIDDSVVHEFTVATTNTTLFQLDGVVATGAPGLGALTSFIGQRVFVQGTRDERDRVLNAVAVEAGNGVPGNGQDWVLGHVVERTGGVGANASLQVVGRSFDVATDTRRFNTVHTVNVAAANTKVARRGAGNLLDTDAINVGQLVWVFGDLAATTLDATASTAVVRLLPTGIFGIANGAPAANTLSLDLVRFDRRAIVDFDFDVSGAVQANPDAFTVDVTGLSTTGITNGSKLRVLGWINGVGASGNDAKAISITNRGTTARVLFCQWSPPADDVISGGTGASLVLDVSDADTRTVTDGFGSLALGAASAPRLDALSTSGFYLILQNGQIDCETTFAAFRNKVLQRTANNGVFRVSAIGTFDESLQLFRAGAVTVVVD